MQNQYRNVLVVSPQIISVILICFIVLFSANLQTKLFFFVVHVITKNKWEAVRFFFRFAVKSLVLFHVQPSNLISTLFFVCFIVYLFDFAFFFNPAVLYTHTFHFRLVQDPVSDNSLLW